MKRSLPALRKWVRDQKARAQKRGDAEMMAASWKYTFRPADDPDSEPREITEEEFRGDEGSGHPQPGEYGARAVSEDGHVLDELTGEWLGDVEKSAGDGDGEGNPFALQIAAITKAATATLQNSSAAESRAERRAKQAEAREEEVRARLETANDTIAQLRDESLALRMERDAAKNAKAAAEAERDAAKADLETMQNSGGELVEPARAFAERVYQKACEHLGEEPIAINFDVFAEAKEDVAAYLLQTVVKSQEGKEAILGIHLCYFAGLPWRSLRPLFYEAWGVDLPECPPIDWRPPPVADDDDAPQENVH